MNLTSLDGTGGFQFGVGTGRTITSQFNALGGLGYSGGARVPVESCTGIPNCGAGTIDSHWRESVFNNELMTGFLNPGVNSLSAITTASMGDLGYLVNYAASDAYAVVNPLAALRATGGAAIRLHDDIFKRPMYVVDAAGRVVGTIAPRR